ncbi:FGGY family carbohydrate kinase, partial [Salmonella enterica subsp. enterica serovar Kentucky]|nr:FGGY family carbohydrate kinase [Salmonella enterica subsp. enterica serovar Kentucky]
VEHDPMEIWASQSSTLVEVLAKADISSDQIAAIGITNQRETAHLSSFTRARSAKQNNTHYENPLKGCRYFLKSAKRYHHHAFRSR